MAKAPRACDYAEYDEAEQSGIKRLLADENYKPAVDWLLYKVCGLGDLSYRPDSARDTDFSEGKRFVALQVMRAALRPMLTTKEEPHARSRHPTRK